MNRPRRRTILKVLLLLAAGATLNVAVAWGCLLRLQHEFGPDFMYDRVDRIEELTENSEWDSISMWIGAVPEKEERCCDFGAIESKYFSVEASDESGVLMEPLGSSSSGGWPLLTLVGGYSVMNHQTPPDRYWSLPCDSMNTGMGYGILPIRPVLPGFAFNTLFYTGVLWMLFCGPFALRRRSRVKRGLCAACAYDLRGSNTFACPECGTSHIPPSNALES